jgi:hypothetical protein
MRGDSAAVHGLQSVRLTERKPFNGESRSRPFQQ